MKTILIILMLMIPMSANADWRGHGGWHPGWHQQNDNNGSAIVGGIIGGLIGNLFTHPAVVVVEPPEGIAPWTQEWYDYCQATYKSFNAQTGYWTGYDGREHFCVAR